MEELNNVGELFRNRLKDHTIEPSDKVWANIQNSIGSAPATSPKPSLAKYFFKGAAIFSVAVATIAVVYYLNSESKNSNTSQQKETQTKEISTQTPATLDQNTKSQTPELISTTPLKEKKIVTTTNSVQPKLLSVVETINSPFNNSSPISYIEKTQPIKTNINNETPEVSDNGSTIEPTDYPKTNINLDITADTIVCIGSSFSLKAKGGTAILWSNGSLMDETSFTAPNEEGVYIYRAMVQTLNGDTTISIKVTAKECHQYEQPNAFTPNGDGKNDIFETKVPDDCTDYSLMIYNRSGMKLFESKDKTFGWDGRYNNEEQKEGAYFYVLQYREKSGTLKTLRGSVIIVPRQ